VNDFVLLQVVVPVLMAFFICAMAYAGLLAGERDMWKNYASKLEKELRGK